jgi:hypothetical protein
MPEEPAPLIVGFVYRDAVDPGLEAALIAEVTDVPVNLKEDLLDSVRGVGGIVQQPEGQIVDRLVEASYELLVGGFFTGAEPAN